MTEFVFPLGALAVVAVILIPALTLLSRFALQKLRQRTTIWPEFGSSTPWALLVFPSLIPLVWLSSAALHQVEPAQRAEPCLVDDATAGVCWDVPLLAIVLGVWLSTTMIGRLRRDRVRRDWVPASGVPLQRVQALLAEIPALHRLRVDVVHGAPASIFTMGWFRPRVVVDACFIESTDDEVLTAALLHELAHVESRDPLRLSLVRLSLSLNPLGRLLAPDLERWLEAREAACDREAILRGGDRLALAQGIVQAARMHCSTPLQAAALGLCDHRRRFLQLRLALLMGEPTLPRRAFGSLLLGAVLMVVLIAPHLQGEGLLEVFHLTVEGLVHGG